MSIIDDAKTIQELLQARDERDRLLMEIRSENSLYSHIRRLQKELQETTSCQMCCRCGAKLKLIPEVGGKRWDGWKQ